MLLHVSISYDNHVYGTIYIKQASSHLDYLKKGFPQSEISSHKQLSVFINFQNSFVVYKVHCLFLKSYMRST